MTTELRRGGIFTKINLNGYLKNITDNETIKINTNAIKAKQKISYNLENEKYILHIISPTKLILNRTTNEIDSTFYFELNKVLPTIYTIKENDLSLEIEIKTEKIEITDKYIKIIYAISETGNQYEYYIEMSEYK